jgi:hypothetical protein
MVITATTKEQILIQLYNQEDLRQYVNTMSANSNIIRNTVYADDVYSDTLETIINLSATKLKTMYEEGWLKFFFLNVARTNICSVTGKFCQKNGLKNETKNDINNIKEENIYNIEDSTEDNEEQNKLYAKCKKLVENYYDCPRKKFIITKIFEMYFEDDLSMGGISKKTRINKSAINKYIQVIKTIIKEKINRYDFVD